jgi:type I restriction enzyme M protein
VGDDYVVLTQRPGYAAEAAWKNEAERAVFIVLNSLRFLRLYQLKAIYPDWPMEVFGEVTSTITPPAKIQAGDFSDVGRYPVIDQSQNAIAGRTDDKSMLVNGTGGLVIFGDHTCAVKFIDERFAQGADGIKIIKAGERLKPKFVYFYLLSRPIEQDGYKRHFGKLKESRIAVPPLATQQAIVAEIEAEQALVTANRELITRFEKKIQATLVRVWGEEAPAKKETDV